MTTDDTFRALVADKRGEEVALGLQSWTPELLAPSDITIRVAYSSVNYKDALAARADGKVARCYPLVPGIDLAGTVAETTDARFPVDSNVLAHGHDLGVAHHGGFAELARIPAGRAVPLPETLTARQAMAIGTAGLTAGAVHRTIRPTGSHTIRTR